ncbi:GlxA family transcriptional regulator [Nonomuraea sp. 10N515B]|uniref:GlxA family transcriptional regulator n=1 Tax=Nonomuraea sp. 10N515B TaxID=3457422 RepID=UPI003FCE4AEF
MTAHLVVIAVYDGVELLDVAGPLEVFSTADRLVSKDMPGYETLVAGPAPGLIRCAGGTAIAADVSWAELDRKIGTLIVPGGLELSATEAKALQAPSLVEWLATPAARDTPRIASVCAGAHILAAAGLLDGRRATTHWATARQLAADHPEVIVEPDAIFVRDEHIWTSAGVSTGIDLALALVADDHNAELARRVARWLVMYMRRPGGQSQFSELLAPSTAADAGIARLQAWIPDHLTEDLSNEALARRTSLSVRHFSRLFRQQLGVTPAQYVESVRVNAAARQLLHTGNGLKTIAHSVGLGSVETLHRVFRQHFGVTPAAYRQRFTTPADMTEPDS